MSLYLNVPYSEKDEAKALGAKWNPRAKKWYVNCSPEYYRKFAKWLLCGRKSVIIPMDEIFIIEGKISCWKCGSETVVAGLGVNSFVRLFESINCTDEELVCEYSDEYIKSHALFRLSWTDKEADIPPAILKYLKQNYSVKTRYSNAKHRRVFANHCKHCGSRLGNWFIFDRPESPFSAYGDNEEELAERIGRLRIKAIPTYDDFPLYWKCTMTPNDYAYFEYAEVEDLYLTDNRDGIASYSDLYLY